MSKLKGCPFCGRPPVVIDKPKGSEIRIHCPNCEQRQVYVEAWGVTIGHVTAKWNRRRLTQLAVLACLAWCLTGCAAYKRSPWTPDTFNYTLARDRHTGELTDYIGFTWNLKP